MSDDKYIPPAPNLAGDDVMFIRYNDMGGISSYGTMHRSLIEAEKARGINIHEVDHFPAIPKRERLPAHDDAERINTIRNELQNTDKYFVSDALDNVSVSEQDTWRKYRMHLREAAKDGSIGLPERPKPHPKPRIL